jgi:hypothetical protein
MHARHAVGLVLVVAACGGRDAAGRGGGGTVTLRYHPPAGAVYPYALEQRTTVTMRSGPLRGAGKQQLNMFMRFTQTVVGPVQGGTEVQVVFDSTAMEMPGVTREVIAPEMAKLKGLRSRVVFDERAQIVSTDVAAHPGVPPELATQMGAGIKAMTFAFPEQPVRIGDSWTVTSELPVGQLPGTDASQAGAATTTLTVREIRASGSDTVVVLDIKTAFPSGPIQLVFAGQQATLTMSGALSGEQLFSLSKGAVVDASIKGTMTMNITAASLGTQAMVMETETENRLRLVDGK